MEETGLRMVPKPKIVETILYPGPHMGMWGSDTSQWTKPRDIKDYPVEKVIARNDPDWIQYTDGIPDFQNPYAPPKALQEDTLKLWRPELLRPVHAPTVASPGGFATSTLSLKGSLGAILGSTVDSWASRAFEKGVEAPTWTQMVRPKLEPLDTRHSKSAPSLRPMSPTSPYMDPAKSLHSLSMQQYARGSLTSSAANIESSIRSDPRVAASYRQRAMAKCTTGDPDGVIRDCNESIRIDPAHAATWARRAEAKFQKGDLQGTIRDCDGAIRCNRRFHSSWNLRGIVKMQMGQTAEAIHDADEARRICPSVPEYWARVAAGKVLVEDFESALTDSSHAIRLDNKQLLAWITRAAARNALEDFEAAIGDCKQALRLDRNSVAALAHRGFAKVYLKDHAGAIVDCNRAIALSPQFAAAYCTRGEAKFASGNFSEAMKDFDQAIAVDPNHARSWWYRGKTFMATGRYDAARKASDQAFTEEPRNDDARCNAELATTYAATISCWKLPIVQRGLQGEIRRDQVQS